MVKDDKVFDDEEEEGEETSTSSASNITKKKILIIILPILIIIGLVVSFYAVKSNEKKAEKPQNYTVIKNQTESASSNSGLILYDFKEVDCNLKAEKNAAKKVKIQLTIETPDSDKIQIIEGLSPRVNTLLIEHMVGLSAEEVQTPEGLYWLKQDLLYRLNLILSPIKVTNINFKTFEIIE